MKTKRRTEYIKNELISNNRDHDVFLIFPQVDICERSKLCLSVSLDNGGFMFKDDFGSFTELRFFTNFSVSSTLEQTGMVTNLSYAPFLQLHFNQEKLRKMCCSTFKLVRISESLYDWHFISVFRLLIEISVFAMISSRLKTSVLLHSCNWIGIG
uniref:Uncharacterized protein n=1 Tax=Romanomermis culicivorax TaxID=13658 RepID=A0A915IW48_ROMCU